MISGRRLILQVLGDIMPEQPGGAWDTRFKRKPLKKWGSVGSEDPRVTCLNLTFPFHCSGKPWHEEGTCHLRPHPVPATTNLSYLPLESRSPRMWEERNSSRRVKAAIASWVRQVPQTHQVQRPSRAALLRLSPGPL